MKVGIPNFFGFQEGEVGFGRMGSARCMEFRCFVLYVGLIVFGSCICRISWILGICGVFNMVGWWEIGVVLV